MKTYRIFMATILLSLTALAPAQKILNDYLRIAAENNPGLKSVFNSYMAALEKAPQAKSLPDPRVAFAYFVQPVETRLGPQQFKFSASQLFPWFGVLQANEDFALQAAKAKFEEFEETKAILFNDVRTTYYELYFAKKAIEITSGNIDFVKSVQRLTYIKVEAGLVSTIDELMIEMTLGDLENELALLKDRFYAHTVMFNNLLNVPSEDLVNVPENLWETDIELSKADILRSINTQNHQLLKAEQELEMSEIKKTIASLNGKPEFSIGFDYINVGKGSNNLSGRDALVLPTIGISIPLYRNKYKAFVKEAAYLETAKQLEIEDKSNVLETLFEMVYKDYKDADRRISLFKKQMRLAEQTLRILETSYANNGSNFEELLRMERQLLTYSLKFEKAKSDKQASISFIHYLMGK